MKIDKTIAMLDKTLTKIEKMRGAMKSNHMKPGDSFHMDERHYKRMREAQAKVPQLQSEVTRLRGALHEIYDFNLSYGTDNAERDLLILASLMKDVAYEALKGDTNA